MWRQKICINLFTFKVIQLKKLSFPERGEILLKFDRKLLSNQIIFAKRIFLQYIIKCHFYHVDIKKNFFFGCEHFNDFNDFLWG